MPHGREVKEKGYSVVVISKWDIFSLPLLREWGKKIEAVKGLFFFKGVIIKSAIDGSGVAFVP